MSADEFPKSAFAPFNPGKITYQNPGDVINSQPFAYFHTPQDSVSRGACWYQPASYIPSVSEPLTRCFGQVDPNSVVLDVTHDNNVANCVTISNEEVTNNTNSQSAMFERNYVNCVNTLQCMLQSAASMTSTTYTPTTHPFPGNGNMQAPASVVPLIIQSQMARSDNLPPRKVYYHKRHHPLSNATSSNFEVSASELKNKTRFSATGASGKSTVVRDCKMSLSSSPPSPSAGSVGGSLCSSISRSHFKPIPSSCQFHLNMRNGAIASSHSPTKISASPSISPAARLSTSSSSGISSRKRRADDESAPFSYRSSGCSSTSDVIAGVGHVQINDRTSIGSVSPVETALRVSDRVSPMQPHKRSKNDNDEDDDVIFVSMEAGVGSSRPKINQSRSSQAGAPFKSVTPVQTARSVRKSKKVSTKAPRGRKSPMPLVISSSTYIQPMPHYSMILGSNSFTPASAAAASTSNAAQSKYFLRSSVNVKKDASGGEEYFQSNPTPCNHPDGTRYFTRSHQKRQQEAETVVPGTVPVVAGVNNVQTPAQKPVPLSFSSAMKVVDKPGNIHAANSYDPSDRARMIILNDTPQRNTSFSKIYDIKGKIGVGGGGVVYAGTRKADNVEVAIKRVPKEKVKRWGKLEGRVVPIEFELLYRAAKSGNKGVIKMFDWFERRSSYILVMERPQPVIDLFDYLNQHGAMPEPTAKKIFRQIVEAVRHCHANGVIHRDIKDENVLLNLYTSEAKLIDFGCGTFMKNEPYTEFAGTPEFYPPEWFIERRYEGRQVDAWSLGVLLYTMVEAEVPFQKEEDIVRCQLKHKRLQGSKSSLCRHLIASMLQKDRSKRLTLEGVLQHPWFNENLPNMQAQSSISHHSQRSAVDKVSLPSSSTSNQPPTHSKTCETSSDSTYPPVVMVQYSDNDKKNFRRNYVASPLPHSILPSECIVHS